METKAFAVFKNIQAHAQVRYMVSSSTQGPIYSRIQEKLTQELSPTHLQIDDESHKHAGHAAMREKTASETHFNVTVVSQKFDNLPLIQRHRLVNDILADEMNEEKGGTVHALSIKAKTPAQWEKAQNK